MVMVWDSIICCMHQLLVAVRLSWKPKAVLVFNMLRLFVRTKCLGDMKQSVL